VKTRGNKNLNNYKQKLEKLYSSLEVLNVPLETKCKHCKTCWSGIEKRMWKDGTGYIYSPWIGNSYDELKMLVLGINMNSHGGYDAATGLAEYSKEAVLNGKRKINFDNDPSDYAGTFYWHRVPAYIVAFLENESIMKPTWKSDGYPSNEDTSKAFNYFAITNSIKCSPRKLSSIQNDRSKPTNQMWENCGGFILKEEIKILKPEKVLICGTSDNASYFINKVLDSPCDFNTNKLVQNGLGKIDGRELEIFIVPHPTSFGGNSVKIMKSIVSLLKSK
jgi:hypothetical protein